MYLYFGVDIYLSSGRLSVCEHMSKGRDNVDSEADEEGSNGRVNGAEKGEDNGQKPYGNHNGKPS